MSAWILQQLGLTMAQAVTVVMVSFVIGCIIETYLHVRDL